MGEGGDQKLKLVLWSVVRRGQPLGERRQARGQQPSLISNHLLRDPPFWKKGYHEKTTCNDSLEQGTSVLEKLVKGCRLEANDSSFQNHRISLGM